MTAGALLLAVIAPAIEPAERPAEAGAAVSPAAPEAAAAPVLTFGAVFLTRPGLRHRTSRGGARRGAMPLRPVVARLRRTIHHTADPGTVRREPRSVTQRRTLRSGRRTPYRTVAAIGVPGGMRAVIAFARSQLGKRYVPGGEGPNGYDCSGFTRTAYARAGLRLPHSSGAQAARAHAVSQTQARPGDLVVGAGHVGLYMGNGMMIDAGNRRTGVVYRRLYAGLHIERF